MNGPSPEKIAHALPAENHQRLIGRNVLSNPCADVLVRRYRSGQRRLGQRPLVFFERMKEVMALEEHMTKSVSCQGREQPLPMT